LLGRKPLEPATPNAIVLTEVTVDCVETVVCLASNDVRFFALDVSLPANDSLVGDPRSHVVERGAPRDDRVGGALVVGQSNADLDVAYVEDLSDVAVGKEPTLVVGLLAHAESLVQQPCASRNAIDASFGILSGGDVEKNRDQFGGGDALAPSRRMVEGNGHPEHLPVLDMVARTQVLREDF
jgi:hypothetical protein